MVLGLISPVKREKDILVQAACGVNVSLFRSQTVSCSRKHDEKVLVHDRDLLLDSCRVPVPLASFARALTRGNCYN